MRVGVCVRGAEEGAGEVSRKVDGRGVAKGVRVRGRERCAGEGSGQVCGGGGESVVLGGGRIIKTKRRPRD